MSSRRFNHVEPREGETGEQPAASSTFRRKLERGLGLAPGGLLARLFRRKLEVTGREREHEAPEVELPPPLPGKPKNDFAETKLELEKLAVGIEEYEPEPQKSTFPNQQRYAKGRPVSEAQRKLEAARAEAMVAESIASAKPSVGGALLKIGLGLLLVTIFVVPIIVVFLPPGWVAGIFSGIPRSIREILMFLAFAGLVGAGAIARNNRRRW